MTRSFLDREVEFSLISQLCDLARRSPSAGNTQAVEFLVLTSQAERSAYWATTFSDKTAGRFRWQGLFNASALVIIMTRPDAYPQRYGEDDKAMTGLGSSTQDWPVPFWWVDAGATAQNLLLGAEAVGLGALLFGIFDNEDAVKKRFEVPSEIRLVATIAIGNKADDSPGRSSGRTRPELETVLHRGKFNPGARA